MAALLEVRGISKRFHANGVQAVDAADLRVAPGEVHAVIGENGAGKSTLMHIIAGAIESDEGRITLAGEPLRNGDAHHARRAGVVMSYQHPRLDRDLTVLENLFLGDEPRRFGVFFDAARARSRVRDLAPDFGDSMLSRRLGRLSSGQVRMVSLVAALLRMPTASPGILILDEPTEAATPAEAERIFAVIRRTADSGHGVIFISHRLPEVEHIADAVTVLRGGRTVATYRGTVSVDELAHAMVGSVDTTPVPSGSADSRRASPGPTTRPVLHIESLDAHSGERVLLQGITIDLYPGEILGLTGIRENGIEAMESLLAGTLGSTRGVFEVDGHDARGLSPGRLRRLGLRYVPTDRLLRGASVDSSVSDNLIAVKRRQLHRAGVIDRSEAASFASSLHSSFGIEGSLHLPLWQLSGGNIQKVILSRELEGNPRLLVICEPSWGLDFRSRALIVARIRASASAGASVVVISTDIDEIIELSDRIVVLFDGRIAGVYPSSESSRHSIGRAMAGAVSGETHG